jgi:hypothetical protein
MQYESSRGDSFFQGGTKTEKYKPASKKKISIRKPKYETLKRKITSISELTPTVSRKSDIATMSAAKKALRMRIRPWTDVRIRDSLLPITNFPDRNVTYTIFEVEYTVQCAFNVDRSQIALQQAAANLNPFFNMPMGEHFKDLIRASCRWSSSAKNTKALVEDLTQTPDGVSPKQAFDPQKVDDAQDIFDRLSDMKEPSPRIREQLERVTGAAKAQETDLMRIYYGILKELDAKIE